MKEVIRICLEVAGCPVPSLGAAFSIFRAIWSLVEQEQISKSQLTVLTECIAYLLVTLDREYRERRLKQAETRTPLGNLTQLLEKIRDFVQKQKSQNFIKGIMFAERRLDEIKQYHHQIAVSVSAFQISSLIRIEEWQTRNDQARKADQATLFNRLDTLEANQNQLLDALKISQDNALSMLASLKRRIEEHIGAPRELEFYSHAYRTIATESGNEDSFELQPWTISKLDVEFGKMIGSGGFGKVYIGTWNRMKVAFKVMKGAANITPNSDIIRREVEVWSKLRHPHILQFLGANILDDEPFIVMPYIRDGNALKYIEGNPTCDRLKLLQHVSLGLVYLHANRIIHGDIKGLNILIDEGERALLCDFGLTKIKSDINSRTESSAQTGFALGSRNWMAPELLQGSRLKKPCDVYSFGMTMYEIYTLEIPLGHVSAGDLRELVVNQDVRPERPDEEEAPQLSEGVWTLAERCWLKDPNQRPSADAVHQALDTLLCTSQICSLADARRHSSPLITHEASFRPRSGTVPVRSPVDTEASAIHPFQQHGRQVSVGYSPSSLLAPSSYPGHYYPSHPDREPSQSSHSISTSSSSAGDDIRQPHVSQHYAPYYPSPPASTKHDSAGGGIAPPPLITAYSSQVYRTQSNHEEITHNGGFSAEPSPTHYSAPSYQYPGRQLNVTPSLHNNSSGPSSASPSNSDIGPLAQHGRLRSGSSRQSTPYDSPEERTLSLSYSSREMKQPQLPLSSSPQSFVMPLPDSPPESPRQLRPNRFSTTSSNQSVKSGPLSPAGEVLMNMPSTSSGSSSGGSSLFKLVRRVTGRGDETFTQNYSNLVTFTHPDVILCASFSSNGKSLSCGTMAGEIRTWDANKGTLYSIRKVAIPTSSGSRLSQVTAVAAGNLDNVLCGTENGDLIYDVCPGKKEASTKKINDSLIDPKFQSGAVISVKMSAGSRAPDSVMASGLRFNAYTADDSVWTWHHDNPQFSLAAKAQLTNRRKLAYVKAEKASKVTCVAFDPSGCIIATGHLNGLVVLSDVATGAELPHNSRLPAPSMKFVPDTLSNAPPAVLGVVFSPNGKKIAVAYLTHEIRLWELNTGAHTVLRGADVTYEPRHVLVSMCFYSSGKRIAYPICDNDGSDMARGVILQDTSTGTVVRSFFFDDGPISKGEIQSILVSPDEKRLGVIFSGGKTALVWVW